MKVLRFKGKDLEWTVPVNEVPVCVKSVLRSRWKEFIVAIDEAAGADSGRTNADVAMIIQFEKSYKAN